MTDPVMADATYIEPLNVERLSQIIEKERPDALLPNLGGQTGLNMAMELNKAGVLDKYGVKVIGVNLDAIERGEDREIFKETMKSLGIDTPRSGICHTVEGAEKIAEEIGYPLVVRPAYTMGGQGGGFCYNVEELRTIVSNGLDLSMTHQCLIEESILGWEELEVEVVRDSKNQNLGVPATSGGRAIRGYALSRSIAALRSATANAAATIPNAFLPKTFSANTKTFAA